MKQLRSEGDTHRRWPSANIHELARDLDAHQMVAIANLRLSQMRVDLAHTAAREPSSGHAVQPSDGRYADHVYRYDTDDEPTLNEYRFSPLPTTAGGVEQFLGGG